MARRWHHGLHGLRRCRFRRERHHVEDADRVAMRRDSAGSCSASLERHWVRCSSDDQGVVVITSARFTRR